MPSFQSTLILFATAIVTVTNGDDGTCEFCPNGITLPTFDINGTNCSDFATMVVDDPTMCLLAGIFELACCPSNEGCDFCPDGVKYPEATAENNGATATCAQLAIA
eukprot:scaffold2053_cov112-Cylindrotheca_fusiformis.AAC.2